MTATTLGLPAASFFAGSLISLPMWWKVATSVKGHFWFLAFVWVAVFIGQDSMFAAKCPPIQE